MLLRISFIFGAVSLSKIPWISSESYTILLLLNHFQDYELWNDSDVLFLLFQWQASKHQDVSQYSKFQEVPDQYGTLREVNTNSKLREVNTNSKLRKVETGLK